MSSFEDKAEGKTERTSGKLKEMAGETLNDEDLAAEGRAQQTKGQVREAAGEVKKAARDAKEDLRK